MGRKIALRSEDVEAEISPSRFNFRILSFLTEGSPFKKVGSFTSNLQAGSFSHSFLVKEEMMPFRSRSFNFKSRSN